MKILSLPLRECGLKYRRQLQELRGYQVTPLAGVWIEIENITEFKGAQQSLPLRECGLKYLLETV